MTVSPRWLALGAVALALFLVLLGNAHLVYVSLESQPECVAHEKPGTGSDSGAYSAAKSSC